MARHYFDPRTGDPISGEEFVRRYTVNAFMFVEHEPEPVRQATAPGLTKFGPVCQGCGTSVEREGLLCDMCRDKPHLQRPLLDLGQYPRPAYLPESEAPAIAPAIAPSPE